MKIEWTKLIPAAVTILALVAVFLVGKFAPDDLAAVTELVGELQPLLITLILAIVGKSAAETIAGAYNIRSETLHKMATIQRDVDIQTATIYSQADAKAQKATIPETG